MSAFEREFADYCGARARGRRRERHRGDHDRAARDGRRARATRWSCPSFTFYASAEAIPPTGATPVFCDIDPDTYCVTAETVRAALTPRTKAVIAVHLFGNVAPVAEIEALGVPVLEDAAQAAGSTVGDGRPGALGTAATFSFFPSKNLGCFGDGGMITTVRRGDRRTRAHAALPRLPRQGRLRAGRLQLAPGRAAGRDPARAAAAPRRVGRRTPARPGATTSEAGLGELVALPRAGRRRLAGVASVRRRRPARGAPGRRARGGRASATRPTTAPPCTARRRCASGAAGLELPGTDQAARTHLAIPMSPVLTREQADEVVAARARRTRRV